MSILALFVQILAPNATALSLPAWWGGSWETAELPVLCIQMSGVINPMVPLLSASENSLNISMDEKFPFVSVRVMGSSVWDVVWCHVLAVALQANRCAVGHCWQCILKGKSYSSSPFPTFSWTSRATRKWRKAGRCQWAVGWDSDAVSGGSSLGTVSLRMILHQGLRSKHGLVGHRF